MEHINMTRDRLAEIAASVLEVNKEAIEPAALFYEDLGMIELGIPDTVMAAGTDTATESGFGTLDRVQNDIPDALRPFDATHKGMLMGEGSVAVALQRAGVGAGTVPCHIVNRIWTSESGRYTCITDPREYCNDPHRCGAEHLLRRQTR